MTLPLKLAIVALFCFLVVPGLLAQGPPYQTDDPVPVDYKHYEFYIFGATDSTPVIATSAGPAFEFNWGALPRLQLHAVLPWGESAPTSSYDKGLGIGKVWYKLPIWMQKNIGSWTLDGGAGYEVVPQTGYRHFPYTGWLVKKKLNERLELGAEVFSHGPEGRAAPQTQSSTMIDMGGYYHFKHNPDHQFLFCYGHSVAGQTENYAYLGMYWTWGKKDK